MPTLLQITDLCKSYGPRTILDNAELLISTGQKVGVIGRNGAGKSTLFKIITAQEEYDSGQVSIPNTTRIGHLTQHSDYHENEPVIAYLMRTSGKEDWQCGKVAGRFQVKNEMLNLAVDSLAGGYQMRVKLISMLLKEPNLLLLDEPTNYLDLSTQILLEKFLLNYNGSFLLISHDREFIKRTCSQTLEIENGKMTLYPRDINEYLSYKAEKIDQAKRYNANVEREKAHLQKFVDRFGSKASKASQAQSKLKQIAKLKTIDIDSPLKTTSITIPKVTEKKGIALEMNDLSIGYGDKIVAAVRNLDVDRGQKIAVVGDNGQGKTTFLKTIADQLQPVKGTFKWGHNINIGYYAQHTPATLKSQETVKEYLYKVAVDSPEQEILQMAGNFLFKDDALKKKISVLSGGEKARLCLATILLQKNEVILLDEPTNHLDFETVEALAVALKESNVTVILVSHNRTFVDIIANGIIEVKNGRITRYMHNYEEYVYHLQKDIEQDLGIAEKPKNNLDKEARKQLKKKLREAKRQLNSLERSISKYNQEKHQIIQWFEQNPGEYSKEKTTRLDQLDTIINEKEENWMLIQEEIEVLEG